MFRNCCPVSTPTNAARRNASNPTAVLNQIDGTTSVLAFTPDRSRIYTVGTGGHNATVSVIDTTTGAVASTISGFKNPQSLAVSPDGTRD